MSRRDCFCCGRWRVHRRSRWAMCLHTCPPKINQMSNGPNASNVLSPHPNHLSANMRRSQILGQKQHGRGWRRVNWRRWQHERMLKGFRDSKGCAGSLSSSPCPPGPMAASCPSGPNNPCDKQCILPFKAP